MGQTTGNNRFIIEAAFPLVLVGARQELSFLTWVSIRGNQEPASENISRAATEKEAAFKGTDGDREQGASKEDLIQGERKKVSFVITRRITNAAGLLLLPVSLVA